MIPGTDFLVELQGTYIGQQGDLQESKPWLHTELCELAESELQSFCGLWVHWGTLVVVNSVTAGVYHKQNSVTWMGAELWFLGKLRGPLLYETSPTLLHV